MKNWDKIEIEGRHLKIILFYYLIEPQLKTKIKDLDPNTAYTIRIRANDNLGPGKLSNPVTVNTQKPGFYYLFF